MIVGLLHELAARRGARAAQMAGGVFGRRAHVEQRETALVRLGAPLRQCLHVDTRDAATRGDLIARTPAPRASRVR